jgi:hypothetical protein
VSKPLFLLTTAGCSLCEKAKEQLWPVVAELGLSLTEVDIIHHPHLLEEYATTIPVLSAIDPRPVNPTHTLAWPFDTQGIRAWYEPYEN